MALYKKNEAGFEICFKKSSDDSNKSDWYILNEDDVTDIIHNVRNGNCCAIIGPPRSQKSYILETVNEKLKNDIETVCILLDFKCIGYEIDERFSYEFAKLFKRELTKHAKVATSLLPGDVMDKNSLHRFIYENIELLNKKLILLIDHFEKLRTKPIELLLEILNEIKSENNKQLVIVIASSFSADESISFFQADHETFMEDLSTQASAKLIESIFEQRDNRITSDIHQYIIDNTAGDRHLISVLCKYSSDLIDENELQKIVNRQEVKKAISWFINEEANDYQPLQKCIRTIEADTISLLLILQILKQGKITKNRVHKEWQPKINKLLIIGAIRRKVVEDKDVLEYIVRNKIYEECFRKQFQPEKIVNILTTAGQWRKAVTYLENEILDGSKDSSNYQWIYLGTVVHSIYAASSKQEVYASIAKALKLIFSINKFSIYIENPERTKLVLVEYNGSNQDAPKEFFLDGDKYHTVTSAYKKKDSILTRFPSDEKVLIIPLKKERNERLGIIAISGFKVFPDNTECLRLNAFLNRVSRAIGRIIDRELQLNQLKSLHNLGIDFNRGNLSPKEISLQTIQNIIEVSEVKAADILLLKDAQDPQLCLKQEPLEHIPFGYKPVSGDTVKPSPNGFTYEVLANRKYKYISKRKEGLSINKALEEQGIEASHYLPMISRDSIIGVMCLYYDEEQAFSERAIEILSLFANQAASAIYNTRLMKKYKILQEISADIASNFNLEAILNNITEHIVDLLDADRSLILLVDMQKRIFIKGTGHNYTQSHIDNYSFQQIKDGISGWVLTSGEGVNIADAQSDWRQGVTPQKEAERHRTGPIIVVPLTVKNKIIGTLTAVNKVGSPVFTDEDYDLAYMLANQSAIAIENAREINEIEQIIEREKIAVSIAAHEICSPLEIISSGLELLSRITSPRKEAECQVRDIYNNLNETIDQISFVGKQGTFSDPNWEPCIELLEVFSMVVVVVNMLRPYAKNKGNKSITYDEKIKDIGIKSFDREATKQVLYNVIMNAVKYSERNSLIHIYRGHVPPKCSDSIEISSVGIGIDKEDEKNIFDLGYRGESSRWRAPGQGKGLYIAKRIMEAQKGDIVLINNDDPTIFRLYFE